MILLLLVIRWGEQVHQLPAATPAFVVLTFDPIFAATLFVSSQTFAFLHAPMINVVTSVLAAVAGNRA
jgi:hypothetical protein